MLIIEKKSDGKPFEIHTTNADKSAYYKPLRNAWITNAVLFVALSIMQYVYVGGFSIGAIIFSLIGLLFLIPTILYEKRILQYSKDANIEE